MTALTLLLGGLTFPALAPVPKEPMPDPMARGAIGIQANQDSLTVAMVYKNMPGERAGLRVGDQIVRVGACRPTTFDDVVRAISSYRPGARVEVEVQRGDRRLVLLMSIAPRPAEYDLQNRYPLPDIDD